MTDGLNFLIFLARKRFLLVRLFNLVSIKYCLFIHAQIKKKILTDFI